MSTEDETRKRHRRLWRFMVVGCAWSFIYTAISLTIMVGLVHRVDGVCENRRAVVSSVRQALERDADWTSQDQIWLDKNIPNLVPC